MTARSGAIWIHQPEQPTTRQQWATDPRPAGQRQRRRGQQQRVQRQDVGAVPGEPHRSDGRPSAPASFRSGPSSDRSTQIARSVPAVNTTKIRVSATVSPYSVQARASDDRMAAPVRRGHPPTRHDPEHQPREEHESFGRRHRAPLPPVSAYSQDDPPT